MAKPPSSTTDGGDDFAAFREAMQDVDPLDPKQQQRVVAKDEALSAAESELRRQVALGLDKPKDENPLTLGEVPQLEPHAILSWKKDGVQREVFSKLRAGEYPFKLQLDLHGLTVKQARSALMKFLQLANAKGERAVLIAHGRGEKSATPARIKSYLAFWLEGLENVIAFHSAQKRQGGTGAVYVLLKKSAERKAETRERFGMRGDLHEP